METSITAAGAIDTFLVLLIGIGPKLALVPFLEITASLDPAKRRVLRKMLTTAAVVAVVLMVLGELLRALLHFTIGSLSIAGGVILLVLAVWMVLGPPDGSSHRTAGKDPMQLAQFPLAVPYLLNPVGIVGLMTISAEAKSLSVFAVEFGILVFVLLLDVVVFRWANRVSEKLDEGRMLVTEKVFGFLIAAIAVQLVLDGLATVGVIAPSRTKHMGCLGIASRTAQGARSRVRKLGEVGPREIDHQDVRQQGWVQADLLDAVGVLRRQRSAPRNSRIDLDSSPCVELSAVSRRLLGWAPAILMILITLALIIGESRTPRSELVGCPLAYNRHILRNVCAADHSPGGGSTAGHPTDGNAAKQSPQRPPSFKARAGNAAKAVSSVIDRSGDRGATSNTYRTYMVMLLIGAPLLIDDQVARNFLERAQHLSE